VDEVIYQKKTLRVVTSSRLLYVNHSYVCNPAATRAAAELLSDDHSVLRHFVSKLAIIA